MSRDIVEWGTNWLGLFWGEISGEFSGNSLGTVWGCMVGGFWFGIFWGIILWGFFGNSLGIFVCICTFFCLHFELPGNFMIWHNFWLNGGQQQQQIKSLEALCGIALKKSSTVLFVFTYFELSIKWVKLNRNAIFVVIKEVWYINQCMSCDQWSNGFIWKSFDNISSQW
jgi:hypothetical protein